MAGAKIIIIKKKGGHAAHHGGAWKVAYADFVTAMMALFMVLWLLSQTDQKQRERISEYFRTGMLSGSTSVLNGGKGISTSGWIDIDTPKSIEDSNVDRQARIVAEALEEEFMNHPALGSLKEHVSVSVTDDGLLIQLIDGEESLLFDSSSADLKPAAVELLTELGPILGGFAHKLQIHGHTDARPFPEGSSTNNWELSFKRADNARTLLEGNGVTAGQIVGVFAHADNSPLVGTDPKSAANRRLAILAVKKGSEALAAKGVPLSTQPGRPVELGSGSAPPANAADSKVPPAK